jgi:hypothetical protein
MHLLLLAIGILVTAVGAVMLAFSVPLTDSAGVALFTSGMIAVVGGFILIGLSAAVRSLSRIAERLDIQPMPVPQVAAVGHEAPAPRPARAVPEPPVAAAATVSEPPKAPEAQESGDGPRTPEPRTPEPVAARGALLGWFGRPKAAAEPLAGSRTQAPRLQAAVLHDGAQNGASQDAAAVDLGALARPPEPLQAPEPFPSIVTRPIPAAPPIAAEAPAPAPPSVRPAPRPAPPPAQRPPAPQNGTAATTVYRSGVIDGMAYSLFMDGSIEADLPTGRARFGTIDELQKYLVSRR